MKAIKTFTRQYGAQVVRRDRKRNPTRMTRGRYVPYPDVPKPNDEKSGDWYTWWRLGCSSCALPDPIPGSNYYHEKNSRKSRAQMKIRDRRRDRRTFKIEEE